MKTSSRLVLLFGLCIGSWQAAVRFEAQATPTFVYTNNDRSPNSVSGFLVAANGSLSPISGSPFLTGGNGAGGGFFSANRINTVVVKDFLYAANSGSNTVSAFSVNPSNGVPTPVPGSPFGTSGVADGIGMSLSATPDGSFLVVANGSSQTITVFSIAADGSLSQVAGSPFPSGAAGPLASARVTSDGKFLAVTSAPGAISMFSISQSGALVPVAGPPLADPGAAGIDCNCASSQLYVALNGTTSARVDVFNIGPSGSLSRIAGAPFVGPGSNSNVPVLNPDDTKLFVSNQGNATITPFSVAANGSLTVVPGAPFPAPGALAPSGMGTNQAGTFLYSANLNNTISGFSIAANGAIAPVPGSPFTNGFPGAFGLLSLTVFPAKNCCPEPAIGTVSAEPEVLFPPNHKLVNATVNYSVTEPCPNSCRLSVSSDEPVNGDGDGNTSPDWQVIDAHHVLLRAERTGKGSGRTYTISITCTNDLNKLSSTKTVTVFVPHDDGK